MRLRVSLFQLFEGRVRVNLGSFKALVTENLLDALYVCAIVEHGSGE